MLDLDFAWPNMAPAPLQVDMMPNTSDEVASEPLPPVPTADLLSLLNGENEVGAALLPASEDGASWDFILEPLANEIDGDEPDVTVVGRRPPIVNLDGGGLSDGGGGGYTGGGGTGGGGGGSSTTSFVPAEAHDQDCGTDDGAAVQIAKHVMGVLPEGVSGPVDPVTSAGGNDWTKVEFGAVIIRNPDGSFGAMNNMIYSSDSPTYAKVPSSGGQPVQGIWHNHTLRGDYAQQMIDRYPSSSDWSTLSSISTQAGASTNPSLWITDGFGVTREFRLSDRALFESLDNTAMTNGQGLLGTERSQSCG